VLFNSVSNNRGAYADGGQSTSPGDGIIDAANGFNRMLNRPMLSSVGQFLNKAVPIVGPMIHLAADTGGHVVSKLAEGMGHAMGSKKDVHTHLEHEWLGRDEPGDGQAPGASTGKQWDRGGSDVSTRSGQRVVQDSPALRPGGFHETRLDTATSDARFDTKNHADAYRHTVTQTRIGTDGSVAQSTTQVASNGSISPYSRGHEDFGMRSGHTTAAWAPRDSGVAHFPREREAQLLLRTLVDPSLLSAPRNADFAALDGALRNDPISFATRYTDYT
jgi:hypothetical protein